MIIAINQEEGFSFVYMKQPVKKWTFEQPKLKKYIEDYIIEVYGLKRKNGMIRNLQVLNLFAGKVHLDFGDFADGITETRVDSSDEWNPQYLMDAFDFIQTAKKLGIKFDVVIIDPPYNIRKAKEKYGEHWMGNLTKTKNELIYLLHDGSSVISLGYDTVGLSESRGFRKFMGGMICHSGDHNDTLIVGEVLVDRNRGLKYCEEKAIYNEE